MSNETLSEDQALPKRRRFAVSCHPVLIGHSCLERLTRAEIETLIQTLMEGRAMDEWGEEEKGAS